MRPPTRPLIALSVLLVACSGVANGSPSAAPRSSSSGDPTTKPSIATATPNHTAPGSPTPQVVLERTPLPSCGTEVVDRTSEGDLHDPEVHECFLTAYREGEPAEMIAEDITVEGDPVTYIVRHLPAGFIEIFIDSTRDPLSTPGWYRMVCEAPVVLGQDAGGATNLTWGGCEEAELL
jgi:hypothetical protein